MRFRTAVVALCCSLPFGLSAPASAEFFAGEAVIGYLIAPVPLNLANKNLVERIRIYRGSYYVNGPMDCFGCHSAGEPYAPGGNPFLGQPAVIDQATYLGGGNPFGPFISRNLTPDGHGRPGGLTFSQFLEVIRKGTDLKALPPAVGGDPGLLQVMPWPAYRHSTFDTLRDIYAYLSVIPCLEGRPGQPANRCAP